METTVTDKAFNESGTMEEKEIKESFVLIINELKERIDRGESEIVICMSPQFQNFREHRYLFGDLANEILGRGYTVSSEYDKCTNPKMDHVRVSKITVPQE